MPPAVDDTWSDSDDELEPDLETAVQLGIPDGPLLNSADISDPSVSRLGGHPTFLSAPPPPPSHAACNNCHNQMELLVQIWCPMEDSPSDRSLLVWGCADSLCQRKAGSIRAWRELKFNKQYAEKLQKRLARRKEKQVQQSKASAQLAAKPTQPKGNPFALGANSAPNPFGLGSQIFGAPESPSSRDESPHVARTESAEHSGASDGEDDEDSDDAQDAEEAADALAAAVRSASLEDSPWTVAPAYSPLYLSTVPEYPPSPPKLKVPAGATVDPDDDQLMRGKDGKGWSMEGYENSLDVDHVFERFSKRVSYEGEQCLRYELGGTPLPFASDPVFDTLFPVPPSPTIPVTKGEFRVTAPRKRCYAPEALPKCPHCQSRRVFECQLMPNLINVLKSVGRDEAGKRRDKMTDQERHAEVLRALKGQGGRGMEWGTCMIFSCEKDCTEGAGMWREEYVLVQWDE